MTHEIKVVDPNGQVITSIGADLLDRLKAENARLIDLSHQTADKLHEMSIRALNAEAENVKLRAALEAAPKPARTDDYSTVENYKGWHETTRAEALKGGKP